ncbi:hypothetical protein E6H21_00105 [Candidatus Bathyarchaeota archaeon]|nr:MAG: hypothetical protein E6H21_00105 [Candidatus Bathyarchaeota archaeon]
MSGDCCLFMIGTRRRKIVSIIIPVAILVASFAVFNPILPRAAALQAHSNILIVGNSEFTLANGVVSGTGTSGDPYVISGWQINSSPTSICVRIANTTAYFLMQNDSISCGNNGTGIIFDRVSNARLESSIVGGSGYTLQISSSTNITLSGDTFYSGTYGNVDVTGTTHLTLKGNAIIGSGQGDGYSISKSKHVIISGNTVSSYYGSGVSDSSDVIISSDIESAAYIEGVIFFERSTNVTVSDNSVQANLSYAIWFRNSNNTIVTNNRVTGGGVNGYSNWDQGIVLESSPIFQIIGNNVTLEAVGIHLFSSTTGHVYNNNLVNNTVQAQDDQPGQNSWDNGYPRGGNYWSDFKGTDKCSGPQQNICPSPDGIGDTTYTFSSSQDSYPLMKPFISDPPANGSTVGGGGGGRPPLRA